MSTTAILATATDISEFDLDIRVTPVASATGSSDPMTQTMSCACTWYMSCGGTCQGATCQGTCNNSCSVYCYPTAAPAMCRD